MIKTSGYRVSPTEVEEVLYGDAAWSAKCAAFGVPHPALGQAIVVVATRAAGRAALDAAALLAACRARLPAYMVPAQVDDAATAAAAQPERQDRPQAAAAELAPATSRRPAANDAMSHAPHARATNAFRASRDDSLQVGGMPLTRLAQRVGQHAVLRLRPRPAARRVAELRAALPASGPAALRDEGQSDAGAGAAHGRPGRRHRRRLRPAN